MFCSISRHDFKLNLGPLVHFSLWTRRVLLVLSLKSSHAVEDHLKPFANLIELFSFRLAIPPINTFVKPKRQKRSRQVNIVLLIFVCPWAVGTWAILPVRYIKLWLVNRSLTENGREREGEMGTEFFFCSFAIPVRYDFACVLIRTKRICASGARHSSSSEQYEKRSERREKDRITVYWTVVMRWAPFRGKQPQSK